MNSSKETRIFSFNIWNDFYRVWKFWCEILSLYFGFFCSLVLHLIVFLFIYLNYFGGGGWDSGAISYGEGGISVGLAGDWPDISHPSPSPSQNDAAAHEPQAAQQERSGQQAATSIQEEARDAAASEPAQNGGAQPAGGGSAGESEQGLLGQIARCLPPDLRPSILSGALVLQFGPDGALAAAPTATSPLQVSAEERAQLDRIVQAAMQCSPYAGQGLENATITIVPDFAGVGAAPPSLVGPA